MIPSRSALVLGAALLAATPALADDAVPGDDDDDARLARLGEHFYARGMFYRAVGTFEELDLFTADPAVRRYARLRVAMAFHRGGQYDDAIAAYDQLLDDASPDAASGWIRIHRSLARAERALVDPHAEPPDVVAAELAPLALDDAPYATIAGYHVVRLRILAGDRAGARDARASLDRRCRDRPVDDCAVLGRLDRGLALSPPSRRSPTLALTLSAVVPGLGSAYSGNVVDGLYYASLTSLFALGAWDVHDPSRSFGDQKATFYVLGTAAVVTYAANVVQAYFGAKRFNLVQQLGWRARVLGATELPLPYDQRPPPGALR